MAKTLQTVKVKISTAGDVAVETSGFKGKSCLKETEQILIGIGGKGARNTRSKPEMDLPPDIGDRVSVKGR